MSKCLLPQNNRIEYSERNYVFIRIEEDPLEDVYLRSLSIRKDDSSSQELSVPIKVGARKPDCSVSNLDFDSALAQAPAARRRSSVQWNPHGDPRFYWIGPQAYFRMDEHPDYFYPISDRFGLSIVFRLPALEFAVLIDRRPLYQQLRNPGQLPGYRRVGSMTFDDNNIFIRHFGQAAEWEPVEMPAHLAPILMEQRRRFLRRYWGEEN